jgi:hypothetical protein
MGLEWLYRTFVPVLALTGLLAFAACSKSGPTPRASSKASPAPEEQRASAAEVAAGLRQIDQITKDIAAKAGSDRVGAQKLDAGIEPVWQKIEGTVKANNQDTYLTFEDQFAVLKAASNDGDPTKATRASVAVSKAVSDYLASYLG